MARAWMCCALVWLMLGCQSGEEPARGARQGVEPARTYQPASQDKWRRVEPPVPERAALVERPGQQAPERDLGSELKAALGAPVDCIRDFASERATTLRIYVSAIVRPTGMIIEPSAYGNGLSKRELDCIEARVGLVVLKPLDEPVSHKASAVIEINYEPPVIEEVQAGTPEPKLPDVLEPLPKKPTIPRSGTPIEITQGDAIEGGKDTERHPDGPPGKKIAGPKPVPIQGYEVDENAQDWTE